MAMTTTVLVPRLFSPTRIGYSISRRNCFYRSPVVSLPIRDHASRYDCSELHKTRRGAPASLLTIIQTREPEYANAAWHRSNEGAQESIVSVMNRVRGPALHHTSWPPLYNIIAVESCGGINNIEHGSDCLFGLSDPANLLFLMYTPEIRTHVIVRAPTKSTTPIINVQFFYDLRSSFLSHASSSTRIFTIDDATIPYCMNHYKHRYQLDYTVLVTTN